MKSAERMKDGRLSLVFRFPYGDPQFKEILAEVKQLPDRNFNKKEKTWEVPDISIVRDRLTELGFTLPEKKVQEERIFVNLERKMKCGVGKSGHCQINDKYACVDGPVLRYSDLESLPEAI